MNGLKSIALIGAFVASALLGKAQEKSDGTYYSESQRQRIHKTLVEAAVTNNPVSKRSFTAPDSTVTLFLGDYKDMEDDGFAVSDLTKRCADEKATHISYSHDKMFYSIAIDDLDDIEENYDSLHRHLKLPQRTSMAIRRDRFLVFENNLDNDTIQSTFITSFLTLENTSKDAVKALQGHEAGHSYLWHKWAKQKQMNIDCAGLSADGDIPGMAENRAVEYVSDSIAVTLYGQKFLDARMENAGLFNRYMRLDGKVLTYDYGFSYFNSDKNGYQSTGLRMQYAEAVLQYLQNKNPTDKLKYPKPQKNWKPEIN